MRARVQARSASPRRSVGLGDGFDSERISITTRLDAVADARFVIEAIVEDPYAKISVLREVAGRSSPDTIVATTTSSLSIDRLARASGQPERFVGFHVFNPVPKMPLVELAYSKSALRETRHRARGLAEALGQRASEVPDAPGFVVNRLLCPFVFNAARLLDEDDVTVEGVDEAITLGLWHPMGPFAPLDLIGLDVACSIGESLELEIPGPLQRRVEAGALGRKTDTGLYDYG